MNAMSLLAGLLLAPAAFGQDASLAIPFDANRLDVMQQASYDANRLEVRQLTTWYRTSYQPYWAGRWGWGWGMYGGVDRYQESFWTVYQGAVMLDAPSYLETVGRANDAVALRTTIRRHRTAATGLWATALVGVASLWVGNIMRQSARSSDEYATGVGVAAAGGLVAIVGSLTASGRQNRARVLQHHIGMTVPYEDVTKTVYVHNDTLRRELLANGRRSRAVPDNGLQE